MACDNERKKKDIKILDMLLLDTIWGVVTTHYFQGRRL